jgi:hypothetical protein
LTITQEGNLITAFRDSGEKLGSVEVHDLGEYVSATNLVLEEGIDSGVGGWLAYEVARVAKGREIYIKVDFTNEKAINFYLKAGMTIDSLVLRKK